MSTWGFPFLTQIQHFLSADCAMRPISFVTWYKGNHEIRSVLCKTIPTHNDHTGILRNTLDIKPSSIILALYKAVKPYEKHWQDFTQ